MSDENNHPGEKPGVIDVPSDLVVEAGAEQPSEPVAEKPGLAQRLTGNAPPLLFAVFIIIVIAVIGVTLARRGLGAPPAETGETPAANAGDPPPVRFEAPAETPLAGDEPAPVGDKPSRDKIFNSISDAAKDGAAAIGETATPAPGAINALPAPPAADAAANSALQDAAKDAAKRLGAKDAAPNAIDLSAPDAGAALERLQEIPAPEEAPAAAPVDRSTTDEQARAAPLNDAAIPAAAMAPTIDQSAEIARLTREIDVLRAQSAPLTQRAQSALRFSALADKALSGDPYTDELAAFTAQSGEEIAPALVAAAASGLATRTKLAQDFAAMRDEALAAARREHAKGPFEAMSANLASMVRLRPAAPTKGASPAAIMSRAEAAVVAGDLSGALAELNGLTGAAREKSRGWSALAQLRLDGEAAIAAANKRLIALVDNKGAADGVRP